MLMKVVSTAVLAAISGMLYIQEVSGQEPAQSIVQPIRYVEFKKLTADMQAFYVAGIIEGISYSSFGNGMSGYGDWVLCVRKKTLGETAAEVAAYIYSNPEPEPGHGVSFAVAKVIGARCRH